MSSKTIFVSSLTHGIIKPPILPKKAQPVTSLETKRRPFVIKLEVEKRARDSA